jgi:hypothetical protein
MDGWRVGMWRGVLVYIITGDICSMSRSGLCGPYTAASAIAVKRFLLLKTSSSDISSSSTNGERYFSRVGCVYDGSKIVFKRVLF